MRFLVCHFSRITFKIAQLSLRLSKMTKKEEKMASVKLSSVIWRRFEEETDGIRWKGKFKSTKAEKDGVSMSFFHFKRLVSLSLVDLYEYKEHIIYDDDENERLQSGSDRYDIKAIVGKV